MTLEVVQDSLSTFQTSSTSSSHAYNLGRRSPQLDTRLGWPMRNHIRLVHHILLMSWSGIASSSCGSSMIDKELIFTVLHDESLYGQAEALAFQTQHRKFRLLSEMWTSLCAMFKTLQLQVPPSAQQKLAIDRGLTEVVELIILSRAIFQTRSGISLNSRRIKSLITLDHRGTIRYTSMEVPYALLIWSPIYVS